MKHVFFEKFRLNSPQLQALALLFSLFVFLLSTGTVAEERPKQEAYNFNKMIAVKNPEKSPPAIPRFLIPEGAVFLYSTDLRSNFYTSLEAFLVMDVPVEKAKVDIFYNEALQSREWKLLQSDYKDDVSIYLSEGFSRKVITVSIQRIGEELSRVRISFKKNSSY